MIPREAADATTAACRIERLDLGRIREGIVRTSHPLMPLMPLMPLIVELSRVVGEPHCGWVHWGATPQNITQTGDVLILRKVHRVILGLLSRIMTALAKLAERSADMVMAGSYTWSACGPHRLRTESRQLDRRNRAAYHPHA
jgi:3-carboxy-cis,cis-muconate cycloisomerase